MAGKTANAQLDRIEGALIGNGREGLIARTARIEEKLITAANLAQDAKTAAISAAEKTEVAFDRAAQEIGSLAKVVDRLGLSVEAHHNTEHLAALLKKPKFYLALVVLFVIMHEVSTALQFGIPALWQLILKLI
jgi:hypothetical protein